MSTVVSSSQLPMGLKWYACRTQTTVEVASKEGTHYARLADQPDKVHVYAAKEELSGFSTRLYNGTFELA